MPNECVHERKAETGNSKKKLNTKGKRRMRGIKNAIIESTNLDIGDRGFLQGWIHLNYGGSGQGFGGYVLYLPKSFTHHKLLSHAGHWIFRVMEVAGVEEWNQLKGKTVRVDCEHSKVYGIGHIVKDDWFYPEKDFKDDKSIEG